MAATDAIARHLQLLPKFLKDDPPFITARNLTEIMSKKGVTEYSQATDILSTAESKVNSGNHAERGRKWLQRFVEILLRPDIADSDVAKDIARSYGDWSNKKIYQLNDNCPLVDSTDALSRQIEDRRAYVHRYCACAALRANVAGQIGNRFSPTESAFSAWIGSVSSQSS